MHIQKLSAIFCLAAVVGANNLKAQGTDSEAQAKARALLRQKMMEESSHGTVTSPPVPPSVPAPAPPVVPPPSAVPPQPAQMAPMAPAPMRPAVYMSPEQEAKARETVVRSIEDRNAKDLGLPPAPQTPEEIAAEQKRLEWAAAARRQMEDRVDKLNSEDASKEKMMADMAKKKHDGFAPGETPTAVAGLVPGSKEQRLYDLLQLYKADKITPTEYHEQRAKIVAEP